MSDSKETKVVDHDYSLMPVPKFARRRFLTMFMIMLGFTFFSASMWTGQQLGDSMDLLGIYRGTGAWRRDFGSLYRIACLCGRQDRSFA